jgi:hypothetical protein
MEKERGLMTLGYTHAYLSASGRRPAVAVQRHSRDIITWVDSQVGLALVFVSFVLVVWFATIHGGVTLRMLLIWQNRSFGI